MNQYKNYYALSEQGKRKNNEDLCHVESLDDGKYLLAVVCDGVGGENGGKEASDIAKNEIRECLITFPEITLDSLRAALIAANNAIVVRQQYKRHYRYMCTCVSACIISRYSNELHIGHVGDTRIYGYNKEKDEIIKLTRDHSFVGRKLDNDEIKEYEAMNHPKRNRIDRCLGSRHLTWFDDYIYATTVSLDGIDRLLLCSDGLYDKVGSPELKAYLAMAESPEVTAKTLFNNAYDKGSSDNISVIIIDK